MPPTRSTHREKILRSASRMFSEKGYPDTDLQALADKLGIGKGTVYRNFPTKRQLFLAVVDWQMGLLRERVREATDPIADPIGRIETGIQTYLRFFDENRELPELLIQERAYFRDRDKPTYFQHREANIERWKRVFAELIQEGRVRKIPVDRITDVISHLLYGTMFTNFFIRRRRRFREQTKDILDVVYGGILSDAERSRRKRAQA